MTAGMLLTLPSGLVAGLYRARGLYGRAVWLQSWATLVGQLAQLVAIVIDRKPAGRHHRLCRDADADRDLPADDRRPAAVSVLARRARQSFRGAGSSVSFARRCRSRIAGATELALLNLPVLLVSALVSDRVAVAQWGLTRVVAGLLRALCVQITLPLAAELGHDHAVGATGAAAQSLCARLGVRDCCWRASSSPGCCRSGRISSRSGPMARFPTIRRWRSHC